MVTFTRTVAPTSEPVTVTEAKLHCRALMDIADDDSLIERYISAAREIGEGYTGRGWFTQTWRLVADDWSDVIELPMAAPLASVTTVKYYDTDGTLQTLSTDVYTVDTSNTPGRVCLTAGQSWPSLQSERRAWRIEIIYVVGWTTVALIPAHFKIGTLLMVDHLYEDRSAVLAGVGVGAVEMPLAISAFWGDRVYWTPSECA